MVAEERSSDREHDGILEAEPSYKQTGRAVVVGKSVAPQVGLRVFRRRRGGEADKEEPPTILGSVIKVIKRITTFSDMDSPTLSVLVKWDGSADAGSLCRTGLGGKFDIELSDKDPHHPDHDYNTDDKWIISRVSSAATVSPLESSAGSRSPGSKSSADEQNSSREGSPSGGPSAGHGGLLKQLSKFDEFSISNNARRKKYDGKESEAERKKLLTSISSSFRQGGSTLIGRARN